MNLMQTVSLLAGKGDKDQSQPQGWVHPDWQNGQQQNDQQQNQQQDKGKQQPPGKQQGPPQNQQQQNGQQNGPHKPWIAVDLDGTLAKHGEGSSINTIGKPVLKMVKRIKAWEKEGQAWGILSARATTPDQIGMIHQFCAALGIHPVKITAQKDPGMTELWDDRAVAVVRDKGHLK